MRDFCRVFVRGVAMVTLVACNTRQIASGHIGAATVVGFCISLLWWSNSSKDRPQGRWMGVAYASGAAVGTFIGYHVANWLGRI